MLGTILEMEWSDKPSCVHGVHILVHVDTIHKTNKICKENTKWINAMEKSGNKNSMSKDKN